MSFACGGSREALREPVSPSNERKQPPATGPAPRRCRRTEIDFFLFPLIGASPFLRLRAPAGRSPRYPGAPILCPAGKDKEDGGGQAAALPVVKGTLGGLALLSGTPEAPLIGRRLAKKAAEKSASEERRRR